MGSRICRVRILEEEMAAYNALSQSIATHRKPLSVVSTLGSDILLSIFEAYRDESSFEQQVDHYANCVGPDADPRPSAKNPLGWIVCSQVCQYWRRLALEAPSLWKEIYVGLGPGWMKISLDRAQSVPGIHIYGNMHEQYDAIMLAAPEFFDFSRLSMLSIVAPYTVLARLTSHLHRAKPALQRIAINVERLIDRGLEIRLLDLRQLISAVSPTVQQISLTHATLRWIPLPFTAYSLTHLEVTPGGKGYYDDPHPLRSVRSAVRFLRRTPALEVLKLGAAFSQVLDDVPDTDDGIVELPNLQLIAVIASPAQCHYLISHVKFPPPRQCYFYVVGSFDILLDGAQINHLVRTVFRLPNRGFQDPEITGSLQLSPLPASSGFTELMFSSTHLSCPPNEPSDPVTSDVNADLRLSFDDSAPVMEAAARVLCDVLPPSSVHALLVDRASEEVWRTFAQHFSHVTIISTGDHNIISGGLPQPCFPELTSLKLKDVYSQQEVDDPAIQVLLGELRRRKLAGRPLQHLLLSQYRGAPAWEGAARELVELMGYCMEDE
ncbi:hypothetical protein BC834DRAFT_881217 [Gloeopeniophorella convolvens]|nr:hypothetical protein BC834DRAFT_881217 [Gloeopeniophorella convolvens]